MKVIKSLKESVTDSFEIGTNKGKLYFETRDDSGIYDATLEDDVFTIAQKDNQFEVRRVNNKDGKDRIAPEKVPTLDAAKQKVKTLANSITESLSPHEKVKMYHKVYQKVFDKLDHDFDNYANVLASELSEYDPNWCAEAFSKTEVTKAKMQDSFAIAITNMLLDGLDSE